MAPKVIRRPAGALRARPVVRRPAAREEVEVDRGDHAMEDELAVGKIILGEECSYFGAPCKLTGRITEDMRDAAGRTLTVRLLGTEHEPLLTWATSKGAQAKVHVCPADCGREWEGPGIIHAARIKALKSLEDVAELPWRDVLVAGGPPGEDELAALRGRMEEVGAPRPGGAVEAAKEIKEKEEKEKKVKKKRKEKRRKEGDLAQEAQATRKRREEKRRGTTKPGERAL